MQPDYIEAHKHSIRNRSVLLVSEVCGCFHCRMIFRPNEIIEWWDEEQTAVCPHCGIDSILGSASVALTPELLQAMQQYWFS